jgi:serine O-acetyltransferase
MSVAPRPRVTRLGRPVYTTNHQRAAEEIMKPDPQSHVKLSEIIDSVVESYSLGRNIDSLETAALPNKRKVIQALIHLKNVIYMGYYATRELSSHNLRQHVGAHLHDAFELLVEQISRAVAYGSFPECRPTTDPKTFAEDVVLEVFSLIPELREKLAMDVEAAYRGDPAARTIEEVIYSYPATEAITVYRIAHEFQKRCVPLIPRIMTEYAHGETGIEIHPGALIGKRFFIDHGTGVVIGETSTLGDDVKLYQGVTLGALSVPRDHTTLATPIGKRHPTLEDRVTVYAGATILGGDTVVGHDSVIGSNVWLTKSVPPGTRLTVSVPDGETTPRLRTSQIDAHKKTGAA